MGRNDALTMTWISAHQVPPRPVVDSRLVDNRKLEREASKGERFTGVFIATATTITTTPSTMYWRNYLISLICNSHRFALKVTNRV